MHRTGLAALFAAAMPLSVALAGPCSDDIAALGRRLSDSAALGPVTTGTLSGSAPGQAAAQAAPNATGTSADTKVGGTAGTKEMNAAAGQIATSPADVRAQQEGKPTAAQASQGKASVETTPGSGTAPKADEAGARAKMELEKARALDAQGDSACQQSVQRVRSLVGGQ